MKVEANSLFQEMQMLSQEAQARNPLKPMVPQTTSSSAQFGELLTNAIDTVNGLQQEAKTKVTAVEMGDRRVSLAEAMIASQKSSVAFEATVQVRNKLVEAYKDIMNMPV